MIKTYLSSTENRHRVFIRACVWVIVLLTAPFSVAVERVPSAVSPINQDDISNKRELRLDYRATPLVRIVLPDPDIGGSKQGSRREVGPLEIGFHREMPQDYANDLKDKLYWFPGDGDTIVAALSVTSPGAAAMRLALRAGKLGEGELRFFGEQSGSLFLPNTQAGVLENDDITEETLWSPVVEGETIGVEIVLPSAEALAAFSLKVEKISHIHTSPESSKNLRKQAECPNQIDVQCRDDVIHEGWEDTVALIVLEEGSSTFLCTGTLLNDTVDGSFIPYFLTANHCVSSAPVARTIAASWFFQRAVCGDGETDKRYIQTAGGADLLATKNGQDATLLRLRGQMPGGLTYTGWSSEPLEHPTDVYGIHHPSGDLKKYSSGVTTGAVDSLAGDEFNGFSVDWYEGVTEGGSSGSGMFRADDGSLVGTLFGGKHDCYTVADTYGSFADFYPATRSWLSPESDIDDDHGDTPASATPYILGVAGRGHLQSEMDIDYFSIELATAGAIRVWTTGSTDTRGAIFRDDGRVRIEDDNSGDDRNFLIATDLPAGKYYIEVSSEADGTGDYALEVKFTAFATEGEHADTRSAATNVVAGSSTAGMLNWNRDLDYFRIELITSGTLEVETRGATDTRGALFAENGNLLAENDDGGLGSNFLIQHVVSAGNYFIEVSGVDDETTGSYTLLVRFNEDEGSDDHGDTLESASDAPVPGTVNARLERDGDTDYYRVELPEDATLWLETSGGIDTDGALFRKDGEKLQEDNRKGEQLMIASALVAGTYYIEVRGAEDFTNGDYVLTLKADVSGRSDTFRDAPTVEVPSSAPEELTHSDRHYFRIELAVSGELHLETGGFTDTFGRLLDEQGKLLSEDDDEGSVYNFLITEVLAPGTYYVEVSGVEYLDGTIATGSYTLDVSFKEFSPDAVDVATPSSTEGQLEADERDYFRIELSKAGDLRVETSGNMDTSGRLLSVHGMLHAEDDDSGAESNFRIEEYLSQGTYYLEISGMSETGSGSYTLDVSFKEFSPDAENVEVPSSTEGQLKAGSRNHFRIELAESGLLRIETSGATRTFCRLLDPIGNLMSESVSSGLTSNCQIDTFVSPGTYYVEISGLSETATGVYTLETTIDAALAVPSSTPAEFAVSGENDSFLIQLTQPGTLIVATSGNLDTIGRLLDENGNVLAENDDDGEGFNFEIKRMLTAGNYIVQTREYDDSRGSYTLHIMHWLANRRLGDLNGDGHADVLLRHLDGRWSLHGMDGRRQVDVQESGLTRNRHWRWNVVADLNGDDNDDLLLRHADGRFFVQAMDGAEIVTDGSGALRLPNGTDWTAWDVAAVGEFMGPSDSKDVLLRNGDGRWRQFSIRGLDVYANNRPGLPNDIEWQVVGVLNGSDLLLRHLSTRNWRLAQVGESHTTEWFGSDVGLSNDPELVPVGIGDFNGDGNDDLLLRHRDGRWEYRAMDGRSVIDAQSGMTDLMQDLNWSLSGIGDLNGDGKDDVLLRHTDGRWYYYAMDGRATIESESGATELPIDTAWSVPPVFAP